MFLWPFNLVLVHNNVVRDCLKLKTGWSSCTNRHSQDFAILKHDKKSHSCFSILKWDKHICVCSLKWDDLRHIGFVRTSSNLLQNHSEFSVCHRGQFIACKKFKFFFIGTFCNRWTATTMATTTEWAFNYLNL